MPTSCSFCGSTLNYGLKFCVVCGRHTSASETHKLGGLKGGIRQGDSTHRLGDVLSSRPFHKTKKSYRFRKHVRWFSINMVYLFVTFGLFFCAVRFVCQSVPPGKIHHMVSPVFGEHAAFVEYILVGKPAAVRAEKPGTKPKPGKRSARKRHRA